MPTVTVRRSVTLQQAATALQDKLGSRYRVTTSHASGTPQVLKVRQSAASSATVHLDQAGNATTFRVHGGGLVSRVVNELGIAKKVAAAIEEAFAAQPAS